ncbi:MAG: purine-nucleoside phosphorylase [Planctomycetota bacterium]|jgi:purine-nucleoside phosphorylase
MTESYEHIEEAAEFLRGKGASPDALVILGTGLGGVSERFDETTAVPYDGIPHFPVSTAPGHAGQLVLGQRGGRQALVMEGRFHCYEGYSMEEVTRPIRVAKALGASTLLLTSAVGGLDGRQRLGEIVVVEDHINLMGGSPLHGPNDERIGPRFPDMSAPYDADLLDAAEKIAIDGGHRLQRAVHASVLGPQLETRAEYRMLRNLGADTVGMSTVPECIAAVHAGMRVCALAVITDLGLPDALEAVSVDNIIAVANAAAPQLESLVLGLLDHVFHASQS